MKNFWGIAGVFGVLTYMAVGCTATPTVEDLELERAYRKSAEQAEANALGKLKETEADLQEAQEKAAALGDEKKEIESQLAVLEENLDAKEREMNALSAENQGLEEEKARLESQVEALNSGISELETIIKSLYDAVEGEIDTE